MMMRQGTPMGRRRIGDAFRHKNISSLILYAVGALVILLLQNAPSFFPTIAFARPVPLIVYVSCVAVVEGAKAGAMIGAISGALWGLYAFRVFGFDALLLMLIGATVGLLVEWLLRSNFLSAMLLGAAAVFSYELVEWLFSYVVFYKPTAFSVLFKAYLPICLYTIVLSPVIYWLVLLLARLIRRK